MTETDKDMDWNRFVGKTLYIITTNSRRYTAKVLEVNRHDECTFLLILDKFMKQVLINTKFIDYFEELE